MSGFSNDYGVSDEAFCGGTPDDLPVLQSWQHVFRDGLAPLLSTKSLEALRKALVSDDPRLLQGATTEPPPLQCVESWPVEAACLVAYCGWQGDGLQTVAEVEEYFAGMCLKMDQKIGEPAGCRMILNWWDDTPREEARKSMLEEVQRALAERLRGEEVACGVVE